MRAMRTTAARKQVRKRPQEKRRRPASARGEIYSPRRLAQFLLENAVNAADYAAARREVRKLGLNPDDIPHTPPRACAMQLSPPPTVSFRRHGFPITVCLRFGISRTRSLLRPRMPSLRQIGTFAHPINAPACIVW